MLGDYSEEIFKTVVMLTQVEIEFLNLEFNDLNVLSNKLFKQEMDEVYPKGMEPNINFCIWADILGIRIIVDDIFDYGSGPIFRKTGDVHMHLPASTDDEVSNLRNWLASQREAIGLSFNKQFEDLENQKIIVRSFQKESERSVVAEIRNYENETVIDQHNKVMYARDVFFKTVRTHSRRICMNSMPAFTPSHDFCTLTKDSHLNDEIELYLYTLKSVDDIKSTKCTEVCNVRIAPHFIIACPYHANILSKSVDVKIIFHYESKNIHYIYFEES